MVGNPASWDSATVSGADTVLTYNPDGGYQQATTLGIGQGAWVTAASGVTLSVPSPAPLSLALPRKVPPGEYSNIPADQAVYEFQLTGADLRELAPAVPDELRQYVSVTSSSGAALQSGPDYGFGYNPVTGVLILSMKSSVPLGSYTVVVTLPDGRQASTTFAHTAMQGTPVPISLQFVGTAPLSTLPGFPTTGTLYEFRLTGFPGPISTGSGSVEVRSSTNMVVSRSWGRTTSERLFVYLSPDTPPGMYTVVVALPTGQQLQVSFSHPQS